MHMLRTLKWQVRYHARSLRDTADNRDRATGRQRLLFIRHPYERQDYYSSLLTWLAAAAPDVYRTCEVRSLPFSPRSYDCYGVVMSWIGDSQLTEQSWELEAMTKLERHFGEHRIPSVNSLVATLGTGKHTGARTMARAGLRTPRTEPIHNLAQFQRDLAGLDFPLLIREEHGHAGRLPILLISNQKELEQANLAAFRNPVAVEFIDVREPDGICRRYRYVAAGDIGISYNLHISRHWEVRGNVRISASDASREEREFVQRPNPHHNLFQRARRELGLGFVGFDYSYDPQENLIVWEANSLPGTGFVSNPTRKHQHNVNVETFAAMVHMLLHQARRPVPESINKVLRASQAIIVPQRSAA